MIPFDFFHFKFQVLLFFQSRIVCHDYSRWQERRMPYRYLWYSTWATIVRFSRFHAPTTLNDYRYGGCTWEISGRCNVRTRTLAQDGWRTPSRSVSEPRPAHNHVSTRTGSEEEFLVMGSWTSSMRFLPHRIQTGKAFEDMGNTNESATTIAVYFWLHPIPIGESIS